MRLFIAIKIPNEIKDYLFRLRDSLGLKRGFNKVLDTHITLKFLGDVDGSYLKEIKDRLSNIKFDEFSVNLTDFGFFPNQDRIRVLWMGLCPEEKIIKLQKSIDYALLPLFPREENFKPHITLTRIRYLLNNESFLKELDQITIIPKVFIADKFSLVKSTLTKKGPIYEIMADFSSYSSLEKAT